ncbi:hypothetical protein ASF43_08820 [Pseudorhodoferax sp. Leaf267]|nr:hypothetical protein ASF43_08820 [Pseudorhodoferax sp. Leaf267]
MSLKNIPFAATTAALATALLLVACGGDDPQTLLASAREYMAKNDHKAAVIQVKNALQKQPDSPEARFLLGSALLSSGDVAAAEIELRKARDLKHPDDQVVPKLAQTQLLQGRFKKLIEEFGNTKLSAPAAVAELQTALASAYAVENNQAASQAALKTALEADPNNSAATLIQLRQKLVQGDIDSGTAQLDALIARDPKNAEAWKLRGDLLQSVKNAPDEALVAYRKASEVRPDFIQGHIGALNLLMRQGKQEEADKEMEALKKVAPNHPETRYLETQIAFAKKDYPKARELAQQLLKVTPNNPRSLEMAGGIELALNSLVTAEEHLSKAVQAAPTLGLARRWLAMTYLRSGQPAKAQTVLASVVNDKTTDTNLLSLAGEIHLVNGDAKKAEEYFARAAKLDPDDQRKRTVLAVTQMASGQFDSGLAQLQDIAASDKGTSADLALISTYMRRNDLDKALKAIDSLEKKTPNTPIAGQLRGRVYFARNDLEGARKSFEASLATNPNYFPTIASLAGVDVAMNKPDDARKRFEDLLSREPKNARAMIALAELRVREAGDHKKEVVDLLSRAIAVDPNEVAPRVMLVDYLLRQQDATQAASVGQAGVAVLGNNAQMLDAAGRAQMAAGDTNQGLTTLAKSASLQPQAWAPLLRLADAQLVAKNATAAEQSLRKALDLQSDLVDAQRRLIGIRLQQDRLNDAVALARTVQKQRPKEPIGFLLEGDARMDKKDLDGAVAAFQAGLKTVASPDLLIRSHVALRQAGKNAEADRVIGNWLQTQPKDVAVPMYLADQALNDKKFAEAEKQYLHVVKVQPNNAVAYNNLAWVTSELKKDGAIAYAEKANQLAPNQAAFMDTMAMLLAEQKEYKKAIELQGRVVGLQANPLFKLNLAKIYAKAGEKDNARKQLDEIAKLGDKYAGQAEVEKLRATL